MLRATSTISLGRKPQVLRRVLPHLVALVLTLLTLLASPPSTRAADLLAWPTIASETKAWTRWWWHGSAVTREDLTREMEKYAAAGLGGLEITPIYGIRGGEAGHVDFLAPEWVDLFEHALAEADRLGMQIDLATGTGWPFGGPWVGPDAACRNLVHKTYNLRSGETLDEPIRHVQRPMVRAIGRRLQIADLEEPISDNADLQALALEQVRFEKHLPLAALIAYGDGKAVDLTHEVDATGRLDWTAGPGEWTLYAVFEGWHGKQVERAGPGGEGDVLDHFSYAALMSYLKKFDQAFADRDISSLRAFFNDSYEVDDAAGNADFTPLLFAEFRRRRGYDLLAHLPALFGKDTDDMNARVLCDYRETLSDLLLDDFTKPWTEWARTHEAITRNQAHGSPANILDLYAASDIPETEGTDRIQFMSAASAAHVTGKRLVSAEAATWLDEHFLGTLAETKRWVDNYFLGGVNHICYHGTCYSPESEPWPGRLFYASVELQPSNPQWAHFKALNDYVARCQSFLQAGKPDNDVLVYYPIHDEWAKRGRTTLAHFNGAMNGSTARTCAERLLTAGYGVDFISDRQLAELQWSEGAFHIGGASYRALVIPQCRTMPTRTLRQLTKFIELKDRELILIVEGDGPESESGFHSGEQNAEYFRRLLAVLNADGPGVLHAVGDETIALVPTALAGLGVRPETFVDDGLQFIRRRFDDGVVYFIVNTRNAPYNEWTTLREPAEAVVLFDPLTGRRGVTPSRTEDDGTAVRLQLAPDQSIIVRNYDHAVNGPAFDYDDPAGEPVPLAGPWTLTFVAGGPELPAAVHDAPLGSWTELEGDAVKNFAGIGHYTLEFSRPTAHDGPWLLDLGEVHESAEVRLNGESLGVVFARPFRFRVPVGKLREQNTLEIDVANLMANRIADLDRRGVPWKKFYNVNMAARRRENSKGGVFDASAWPPHPSGLLGPVHLTPLDASPVGP